MKTTLAFALVAFLTALGSVSRAQPAASDASSPDASADQTAGGKTARKKSSPAQVLVDKSLDEIAQQGAALKKCLAHQAVLQKEYEMRREEIKAGHGGSVPNAYGGLLEIKMRRVSRLQSACLERDKTMQQEIAATGQMVRSLEPRSDPTNAKRRARYNELVLQTSGIVRITR